jgi:hypothetical protein
LALHIGIGALILLWYHHVCRITLKATVELLYGLLILKHGRREILCLAATANPSAEWITRQLMEAYGWEQGPRCNMRPIDSTARDAGEFVQRQVRSGAIVVIGVNAKQVPKMPLGVIRN